MWSVFSKIQRIQSIRFGNAKPWEPGCIFLLTTKVPIDLIGPHPPRRHLATQLSVQLRPRSARCNMHPTLLIDELLREVFDLCCLDNEYRKTLVQLARCCQAWKEPALQKAWENLPCIAPLVKLIVSTICSRASSYIPLTSILGHGRCVPGGTRQLRAHG